MNPRMMMSTRVYEFLNHVFGKPQRITHELNRVRQQEYFDNSATKTLQSYQELIQPEATVMIAGSGTGVEIPWFAERVSELIATDVSEHAAVASNKMCENYTNARFLKISDSSIMLDSESVNLVYMRNVCEHILHIEDAFAEYYRILKPGGRIINCFCPLFYSPFGAHLQDALKVPWGHLVFGVRTIWEVRNLYYPSPQNARTVHSWADLGLNRITESQYRRVVAEAGFHIERYGIATSGGIPLVDKVPLVRNLFINSVESVLLKPE